MLSIRHIELRDANDFVAKYHRHHKPVRGHRYSLGCYQNNKLVGVAIVGRPVARAIDQIYTVEILRLATDGTSNACSKLYGSTARAARELGYRKIITYILENETGSSLRASGFKYEYTTTGGSWNTPSRERQDKAPTVKKKLYSKTFYESEVLPQ